MNDDRLIVALDFPKLESALELSKQLKGMVNFYKVGLELFLNTQGKIIDLLKQDNNRIFLDLKFHDIPNTVAQAAEWAASLGVDMFNVHAGGGEEMLRAAADKTAEVFAKKGHKTTLIGVTVLTSFSEQAFKKMGFSQSITAVAKEWASICMDSGLDGVVCSPQEAREIKKMNGENFLTVCPGIRPVDSELQDQKRIASPAGALENGADYLVIGRPITQADEPQMVVKKILEEMERF